MRIQARQQLLEIWRATARSSFSAGEWKWGGRDPSNSISDAEQLLCLMMPATEIPSFKLDRPDEAAEDVLEALAPLGDSVEIPRRIIRIINDYLERYTDADGTPVFGGSYFSARTADRRPAEPTTAQRDLDVVNSFAMSVMLTLATIGFLRAFRGVVRRDDILEEIQALETRASMRLSAAMVGLLRSFTVKVFDATSTEGQALCRTANQSGLPQRQVVEDLRRALRETIAGFREMTIGSGRVTDLDINPNLLFECGWSWGVVSGAPIVRTSEEVGKQREGVAEDAPYLYFTVVALDAIANLFSERTRILGLLNEEQQRLSRALQVRWDLTQTFWSKIAIFGDDRWPLEDLPWRTTDGHETDYYTLLVTSITLQDLVVRRRSDEEIGRVGQVLTELANRGRITRRAYENDPGVQLHAPGLQIDLVSDGETGGRHDLAWVLTDFSPLLLKRTVRIAGLLSDTAQRKRLLDLADRIWEHLLSRRLREGSGRNLWDQPTEVFSLTTPPHQLQSWHYTQRVVECLVTAANVVSGRPVRSDRLYEQAQDRLIEAEHLFDQELLNGSTEGGPALKEALEKVRANLERARAIVNDRPGSADVLACDVLRLLDGLAAARSDINRAS